MDDKLLQRIRENDSSLTIIDLYLKRIESEGMKSIAETLKINTVSNIFR